MKHLMLDLETYDTSPTAAVASIGAVFFNPETGHTGEAYKINCSFASNHAAGLSFSTNTLNWWANQSEYAQEGLAVPAPIPLIDALHDFAYWMLKNHRDPYVWGNGITFDNVILRNAYRAVGMQAPWHWRNDMDIRTLVKLGKRFGEVARDTTLKPDGLIKHDAVHDCLYQIRYVSKIWQHFRDVI